MTPEEKTTIDNMSYESLLTLWRFAPAGHPLFKEEAGDYYSSIMRQKRIDIGEQEAVAASKRIGWGE